MSYLWVWNLEWQYSIYLHFSGSSESLPFTCKLNYVAVMWQRFPFHQFLGYFLLRSNHLASYTSVFPMSLTAQSHGKTSTPNSPKNQAFDTHTLTWIRARSTHSSLVQQTRCVHQDLGWNSSIATQREERSGTKNSAEDVLGLMNGLLWYGIRWELEIKL